MGIMYNTKPIYKYKDGNFVFTGKYQIVSFLQNKVTKNKRGDKIIKIESTDSDAYWKGSKLKVYFDKKFIGAKKWLWYDLDGRYFESNEYHPEMELV
jgi:hypothetical protein